MAVINSGDWPITASATSGSELATKLNRLSAAFLSSNASGSRPTGATAGLVWSKSLGSNRYQIMLFNGTTDVVLLDTAPTDSPYYTKAEINTIVSSLQTQMDAIPRFPVGGIILWSGAVATIPAGWALCNGANGTPDLRSKFVVGAGSTYSVGAGGGSTHITEVPKHSHSFSGNTGNAGSHTHEVSVGSGGSHSHRVYRHKVRDFERFGSSEYDVLMISETTEENEDRKPTGYTTNAGSHSHTASANAAGSHSHSVSGTTGNTGDTSVETLPPYYALAYIMKV